MVSMAVYMNAQNEVDILRLPVKGEKVTFIANTLLSMGGTMRRAVFYLSRDMLIEKAVLGTFRANQRIDLVYALNKPRPIPTERLLIPNGSMIQESP